MYCGPHIITYYEKLDTFTAVTIAGALAKLLLQICLYLPVWFYEKLHNLIVVGTGQKVVHREIIIMFLFVCCRCMLGVYQSARCRACHSSCIGGMRWKCAECINYDLCTSCYFSDCHRTSHAFLRYTTEDSTMWVQQEVKGKYSFSINIVTFFHWPLLDRKCT